MYKELSDNIKEAEKKQFLRTGGLTTEEEPEAGNSSRQASGNAGESID